MAVGLFVTAKLLYMFRTLFASIFRSTKNCRSSLWWVTWDGVRYPTRRPRSMASTLSHIVYKLPSCITLVFSYILIVLLFIGGPVLVQSIYWLRYCLGVLGKNSPSFHIGVIEMCNCSVLCAVKNSRKRYGWNSLSSDRLYQDRGFCSCGLSMKCDIFRRYTHKAWVTSNECNLKLHSRSLWRRDPCQCVCSVARASSAAQIVTPTFFTLPS